MSVKDTSIIAYQDITDSGAALTQKQRVYQAIKASGPLTRQELAKLTGLAINAICGRVNELLKEGVVLEHDSRRCRVTGRLAHPVSVTSGSTGAVNNLFSN